MVLQVQRTQVSQQDVNLEEGPKFPDENTLVENLTATKGGLLGLRLKETEIPA